MTLRFYRDVIGLSAKSRKGTSWAFEFGDVTLWLDLVEDSSQTDVWLELLTDDADAAAAYLEELTANLLNPSIAAWLPHEVVTNRNQSVRPHKMPEEDLNDDLRMRFADDLKDAYDVSKTT